jgi:hypothetical protein
LKYICLEKDLPADILKLHLHKIQDSSRQNFQLFYIYYHIPEVELTAVRVTLVKQFTLSAGPSLSHGMTRTSQRSTPLQASHTA